MKRNLKPSKCKGGKDFVKEWYELSTEIGKFYLVPKSTNYRNERNNSEQIVWLRESKIDGIGGVGSCVLE